MTYQKGNIDDPKTATSCSYTSIVNTVNIINHRDYKPIIIDVVAYLNERAGTNFKASSEKTQTLIKSRLNEGYTVDDFKKVIDNKVADWKDDHEMARFIRPMTLFGTKFESYLNQQTPKKKGEVSFHGGSFDTNDFFQAAVNRTCEDYERRNEDEKI